MNAESIMIGIIVGLVVWIANLYIEIHTERKLRRLNARLADDMRKSFQQFLKFHDASVSDFYTMYTSHQADLLKRYKELAERHMDTTSVEAADAAIIALARLKEVHLDKYIMTGEEDVQEK